MKDITCRFTLHFELVVDCCAGTFSVAKAFMLFLRHKRFVGSDPVLEFVASRLLRVALMLLRLVLSEESKNSKDEDVHQAASIICHSYGRAKILNVASMNRKCLVVLLFCKRFRCIYSTICEQILWCMIFVIGQNYPS